MAREGVRCFGVPNDPRIGYPLCDRLRAFNFIVGCGDAHERRPILAVVIRRSSTWLHDLGKRQGLVLDSLARIGAARRVALCRLRPRHLRSVLYRLASKNTLACAAGPFSKRVRLFTVAKPLTDSIETRRRAVGTAPQRCSVGVTLGQRRYVRICPRLNSKGVCHSALYHPSLLGNT